MQKKVLFVCNQNICRSVTAEALCNRHGRNEVVAESVGADPGMFKYSVNLGVGALMKNFRVDVLSHKRRYVKEVDLSLFDVIVNMSDFPIPTSDFRGKIIDWDIPDPRGYLSREIYAELVKELEKRTLLLIESLDREG